MAAVSQSAKTRVSGYWRSILGYGAMLFAIYSLAAVLVEPFSGSCMFIIPIFFYALITVYAVLKLQRFGTGTALFLLFATLGVLMDYYGDWVYSKNLIGPGYAIGWAPVFLGFGFAVDLAYRFTPERWSPGRRAVFMGIVFGLAYYLLVLFALSAYYPKSDVKWHLWYFTHGIYFTLPWILVNGGFGGFTAYAILHLAGERTHENPCD